MCSHLGDPASGELCEAEGGRNLLQGKQLPGSNGRAQVYVLSITRKEGGVCVPPLHMDNLPELKENATTLPILHKVEIMVTRMLESYLLKNCFHFFFISRKRGFKNESIWFCFKKWISKEGKIVQVDIINRYFHMCARLK